MRTASKPFLYRKEKKIQMNFGEDPKDFYLVALSARKTEDALLDAQEFYQDKAKKLADSGESLRGIFELQEKEVLVDAFCETERSEWIAKAARTIIEKDEEYESKLREKTEVLLEKRREEVQEQSTEELISSLVRKEMLRQLEALWQYASLGASLAQGFCDSEKQQVFSSLVAMTEELSPDQIEELLMIWMEFVSSRGNAQVFPEPCTSKG